MKDIKLSRRGVFGLGGGAAIAAMASNTAAASAPELDEMRSKIGTRVALSNDDASSGAVLEDVVSLGPHVRPPFEVGHRKPFALIFRVDDPAMEGGTYQVASTAGLPEVMMLSQSVDDAGVTRLEAVFN